MQIKWALPFALAAFMFSPAAFADDEKKVDEKETNPVMEALIEFSDPLPPAERRHANIIFSNYNVIKVVEQVEASASMATESCGEKNEDLKAPLENRFGEWQAAIHPIMEEAAASVNNMIAVQEYAKPKTINKLLGKIDDSRKGMDEESDRVPVTTPEACRYLLDKMDETQPALVKLLENTLISLPMSIQQEQAKATEEE
ncbi:MAG: hypothetical protein KTR28_00070 [Micavibrio sp.]|nr:hypothetical protein [Micavibrio sp.]